MALVPVHFEYRTGLRLDGGRRPVFRNVRLSGSWDGAGRYADQWSTSPMADFTADDGCVSYRATVELDDSQTGWLFRWGVLADSPQRQNVWVIPTEVRDSHSSARYLLFNLREAGQTEQYYLTHMRRLGANKVYADGAAEPAIRFACWAPNARSVEVAIGDPDSGYIFNDGRGIVEGPYPMHRDPDGVWSTDSGRTPQLARFADWDHRPYMFRVTKDDGQVAFRTDIFSRCQIGRGNKNPDNPASDEPPWDGTRADVDGTKGCSVVVDPENVTALFDEGVWPETRWTTQTDFWRDEFDPLRPLPTRLEDLVIYEMHVAALGFGKTDQDGNPAPGTLEDAIDLLDYLVDLGVNCIELLPMNEYEGNAAWGYGSSHFLAIEFAGGGRDQMKFFVRECHRRGIAALLDVVYNHYIHDGERAEWTYDSNYDPDNIYYWYEGRPEDYPAYEEAARMHPNQTTPGHGGYVDNMSTGYAPRFHEDWVRKLFISSAAMLLTEFHFDGFRVDQTTSIHAYAVLHANGAPAEQARIFGQKFLREWCRTMKLIKPACFLIAEDHSGWPAVTQPPDLGGLGFDAIWYADFYHHLIGDGNSGSNYARLLHTAGLGGDGPLAMDWFAGVLAASAHRSVVYHESHDEAGNAENTHRTIVVAVNGAPLIDDTRRYAEARTRFCCGMTLLAPGTPMFFMGEEVGAAQDYRYGDFLWHREDLEGLRRTSGANLFRFYRDIIRLRRELGALRSGNIDIVHVHNANRVIAFRRWMANEQVLVLASLNNRPFDNGYAIGNDRIPAGEWREIFNSDSTMYGGNGLHNPNPIRSDGGAFNALIPANGLAGFERV